MEIRNGKMIIGAAGGTAGKGAKTYKVSIPSAWAAAMGVDCSGKEIELQFDGEQIVIKKKMSGKAFAEQKKSKQHHVTCFKYYNSPYNLYHQSENYEDTIEDLISVWKRILA